jgi:hypothetical protein
LKNKISVKGLYKYLMKGHFKSSIQILPKLKNMRNPLGQLAPGYYGILYVRERK